MIFEPLIRTDNELALVLNCIRVERERFARLAEHMTTRKNKARYAAQVVKLDALYEAMTKRLAKAKEFNPMDGDPVALEAKVKGRFGL